VLGGKREDDEAFSVGVRTNRNFSNGLLLKFLFYGRPLQMLYRTGS
jgi:hypothetical protein